MEMLNSILFIIAAYLWGSLSPAYIIARLVRGIDLRTRADHEVSGTTLGDELGRQWTWPVAALDLFKGIVPPALALQWGMDLNTVVLAGLATVIGHNWSLYLKFEGGRGLAAALGALLVWDVRLGGLLLVFYVGDLLLKQNGRGPMLGFLLIAPLAWILGDAPQIVAGCAGLAILIALKRLEASRSALPADWGERRAVLWRRFWTDVDAPTERKEM
jgi:acyl phosphate:glycerol-3-phosphate acyltransferase